MVYQKMIMKKTKTSKTHPDHYAKQGIEPIEYIEAINRLIETEYGSEE